MASVLDVAHALIGRSSEQVRAVLDGGGAEEAADDYQRLEDVTSIRSSRFPGTVYLRDGVAALVYLGPEAVAGLSPRDLEASAGSDPVMLASRAGHEATLVVHAQKGLAYSAAGDEVQFVEVFAPCTQAEYEAGIYEDPGPFRR
jgi:hypothetical protein